MFRIFLDRILFLGSLRCKAKCRVNWGKRNPHPGCQIKMYVHSQAFKWLYCHGNEAERATSAMMWLQMSHDAPPSLERDRMGRHTTRIWPFTWSGMPNFRPRHDEALTTHYTNERGYFTCCRHPRDWLVPFRHRSPPLFSRLYSQLPHRQEPFRLGRWPLTPIIANNFRQWIKIIYIACQRLCTRRQVRIYRRLL